MSWRVACAMLAFLPGVAIADVENQIAQLVEWQEAPLDLRDASAHELVLLPGIDTDLAESILRLREMGELRAVADLRRVPGLAPSVVDALRPYVHVGGIAGPMQVRWEATAQHRDGAGPRTVHRLRGGGERVEASAVLVQDTNPRWRAAFGVRGRSVRVSFGHLRMGPRGGILDPVPGRSRTAPAARPRASRVRARTDSSPDAGWTALALSHRWGYALAARDQEGQPVAGAGVDLPGPRLALHASARADRSGWAASVDLVRDEVAWLGLTVDGDTRSARAGLRHAGSHWRVGLDASTTDGALRLGSDPVSGHRLDREHHVIQVFGRLRSTGWSVGALWRDLGRGAAPSVSTVGFEAVWRGPTGALLDEVSATMRVTPQRRITLTARGPTARGEWRLRFARESDGAGGSELFGAEHRLRTARQELRVAVVGVDGNASRVWMFSRPGTGVYPIWIRPPGALLGTGWGLRAGMARLGAWIWARLDSGRAPSHGIGLFCSLEASRVVRRLQGPSASGTGAPSRRSPEARPRRSLP